MRAIAGGDPESCFATLAHRQDVPPAAAMSAMETKDWDRSPVIASKPSSVFAAASPDTSPRKRVPVAAPVASGCGFMARRESLKFRPASATPLSSLKTPTGADDQGAAGKPSPPPVSTSRKLSQPPATKVAIRPQPAIFSVVLIPIASRSAPFAEARGAIEMVLATFSHTSAEHP
jgi:hypothetical protein